ncbi:MAG: DUF3795 domain-containing protein [Eubacteriales bacterium]
MEEYIRATPLFSLCGLNCGLCPRYRTQGESKCPGCGGTDFRLKHPACAVITCSKKHGDVEYCFECSSYPCERYSGTGDKDSFISYRNVITDFAKAKTDGIEQYITDLREKIKILDFLLNTYNDGRRKAFYCNAVNMLPLPDLREIMKEIQEKIAGRDLPLKEQIEEIVRLFEARAASQDILLKLRK